MLLTEESLNKVPGTPVMSMKKIDTKPLKSCLRKKNRRKTPATGGEKSTPNAAGGNGSKPFRRSVSFTGLECNSRWDSDTPALAAGLSLPQHLRIKLGNGSTNASEAGISSAPRLPRRPLEDEQVANTSTQALATEAAPMPPRRMRSHENLFQYKIDFFLEQTASNQKKLEKQQTQNGNFQYESPPKDIEALESSLFSMQQFLVALTSMPNNQKLLQKHMEHQTSLQAQIEERKRGEEEDEDEEEYDSDDEDYYDEDDDDASLDSDDEEDDDDDDEDDDLCNEILQEIQKNKLEQLNLLMGSDLFDISNTETEGDESLHGALSF